jgi:hypothetical protein
MTVDEIKNNGIYLGVSFPFPKRAIALMLSHLQENEELRLVTLVIMSSESSTGALSITNKRLIFTSDKLLGSPIFREFDLSLISEVEFAKESDQLHVTFGEETKVFENISHRAADALLLYLPVNYKRAPLSDFDNMIASYSNTTKPTTNAGLDDLEKLADLHNRGIITEEEFTASKKKILGI